MSIYCTYKHFPNTSVFIKKWVLLTCGLWRRRLKSTTKFVFWCFFFFSNWSLYPACFYLSCWLTILASETCKLNIMRQKMWLCYQNISNTYVGDLDLGLSLVCVNAQRRMRPHRGGGGGEYTGGLPELKIFSARWTTKMSTSVSTSSADVRCCTLIKQFRGISRL